MVLGLQVMFTIFNGNEMYLLIFTAISSCFIVIRMFECPMCFSMNWNQAGVCKMLFIMQFISQYKLSFVPP